MRENPIIGNFILLTNEKGLFTTSVLWELEEFEVNSRVAFSTCLDVIDYIFPPQVGVEALKNIIGGHDGWREG